MAHCIPARLEPLPEGEVHQNQLNYYKRNLALHAIVDTMKGKYIQICGELGRSPSTPLLATFNYKLKLLESLGERSIPALLPVAQGVQLVNKGLFALSTEYQRSLAAA